MNTPTPKLVRLIKEFQKNYLDAISSLPDKEKRLKDLEVLIQLIFDQIRHPHSFEIFHKAIRKPFDYYQFGNDFIRPFIDFCHSKILGEENLQRIEHQIKEKENVILLANHQTEPDPQVISLLLENKHPHLASEMVFVAGHRVITDPMAIPMSLGRNLLCIYSKKHISYPPEKKEEKILHNQRTLKQMQELLNQGGYCIYVAPSGGRDRTDGLGNIQLEPFDPQSIELFWLLGNHAEKLTHFYPLALKTYDLMPPPRLVEKELGEQRSIHFTSVFLSFGDEIDMVHFPGSEEYDKKTFRKKRAEWIWHEVCRQYRSFYSPSS